MDDNGAQHDEVTLDPEALRGRVAELEERAAAFEARWRDGVRDGALTLALHGAGCRDVEAALLLLDRAAVRVDEAGAVTGVEDAVAALRAVRGYLFTPRTLGGGVNPAGTPPPANPAAALADWLRGRG